MGRELFPVGAPEIRTDKAQFSGFSRLRETGGTIPSENAPLRARNTPPQAGFLIDWCAEVSGVKKRSETPRKGLFKA